MGSVRILQIGPYPPPGTGWSIRIKMLQKYLERAGHDCLVMNTNKNRRARAGDFVPIRNGLDYVLKVLRFSARGYLIHIHINGKSTKSPILAIIAELIGRLSGRPAVLTFHAGVVQDYFPKQQRFWLDNMFRLIFLMAGRIVCNNDAVKQKIVEYGIAPDKLFPIPAFCREYLEDKAEMPPALQAFMSRHAATVCSYVYLRPDFNIAFLLDALRELLRVTPELGIVLMGAYREANDLQAQLRQYGLFENSHVAGDLEHGHFLAVLEACQVYIRTPMVDGVSSSVLEALLLGTQVVASNNGSRPPGVITYQDGSQASFLTALRQALAAAADTTADLPSIRQSLLRRLDIRDTLDEEISLLVAAAA